MGILSGFSGGGAYEDTATVAQIQKDIIDAARLSWTTGLPAASITRRRRSCLIFITIEKQKRLVTALTKLGAKPIYTFPNMNNGGRENTVWTLPIVKQVGGQFVPVF